MENAPQNKGTDCRHDVRTTHSLFWVYMILIPNGVFGVLGGVLLAVVGLYELGKVALQSNYSIDITQG